MLSDIGKSSVGLRVLVQFRSKNISQDVVGKT